MANILIGLLGRRAETWAAYVRSGAREVALRPLEVNVIFTSAGATVSAMDQAARLASDLSARVCVFAPVVVDFHTNLEHPRVNPEFLAAQYRAIAEEAGVETSVQIVLCRDVVDGLNTALRPNSLVVVGGRKRWWRTRESKLARALEAAGHQVLFVTKESTTCSTCSMY
ncbi:MAG TPA: hypothetical protein VGN17_19350 [Bryobacteraceae bacterium]|jgi:hypothetical protein